MTGFAPRQERFTRVPDSPIHYFSPGDQEWEPRPLQVVLAGQERSLVTAPGIFSPDRLDIGTAVLLDHVPPAPALGTFVDLGCGWGPLALTLALTSPKASVLGVDVNPRCVELLRHNAAALACDNVTAVLPTDVPESTRCDLIWSNPPIRIGKPALHAMLQTWLPRLVPGGQAYLVVQKNLGSDSLQTWLGTTLPPDFAVRRHASSKGFRVLAVTRDE